MAGIPDGQFGIIRADEGSGVMGSHEWVLKWEVEGIWYIVQDRFPGLLSASDGPDFWVCRRSVTRREEPERYMARMSELATSETIWAIEGWRGCLRGLGLASADGKYPMTEADMKKTG